MRPFLLPLVLAAGCAVQTADGPPAPQGPAPADTLEVPAEVGPFEDMADYLRQRDETAAALERAIRPAEASGLEACRVVPTSEQACGGPASFAVYSVEDPDAAEVERLAERLVALDVQANAQFERASTCVAYEPPTPAIRDGACVAPE